ncbi:hypothetical protein ACQ1Y8_13445, partial [Enterococcus faecalis]|uniref:hypothetical protein n=1 Tax=Enterococcus faecalis TaxID=1351 RepID=UPI003D6A95BD
RPTIRRGGFGRWTVHEPDGTATNFRTHAQAIHHADEIARTITITLPPYRPQRKVEEVIVTSTEYGGTFYGPREIEQIDITPSSVKTIALALLATAHHQERNQK